MALGLGLRPREIELALSIPLPPFLLRPGLGPLRHRGRPDEQGTAPRGRGECGFRSPKSFLGVNFFEGLPTSGPKNKGAGQKNRGFGHHDGGITGMVHTILVELTKWWMLTICKRLMICRCRQNIPTAILLRSTKSGRNHLAGGEVHRMFTFASPETALWGKRCPTMSRFLWYN